MKTTLPDELKATVPQSQWGKILMATPVIMTVVATLLAGLASSEMTRAQYDRALAAQQQSKAGDQWSYFQAKRLRSALQRSTLDLLQATAPSPRFDAPQFRHAVAQLSPPADQADAVKAREELMALMDSSSGGKVLAALQSGELPEVPGAAAPDPSVQAALEALETMKPDPEIHVLLARAKAGALESTLAGAVARAQAFDLALQPWTRVIEQMDRLVSQLASGGSLADAAGGRTGSLSREFTVARLRYQALRYDLESRLNQAIANVYELQVRQSNLSAERHHRRSQRFFFGMLVAQAAVIIATFSIAAQKRSLLWSLAAAAGLAAIGFAVYVYFYI
jgi:hypothetical protein